MVGRQMIQVLALELKEIRTFVFKWCFSFSQLYPSRDGTIQSEKTPTFISHIVISRGQFRHCIQNCGLGDNHRGNSTKNVNPERIEKTFKELVVFLSVWTTKQVVFRGNKHTIIPESMTYLITSGF